MSAIINYVNTESYLQKESVFSQLTCRCDRNPDNQGFKTSNVCSAVNSLNLFEIDLVLLKRKYIKANLIESKCRHRGTEMDRLNSVVLVNCRLERLYQRLF